MTHSPVPCLISRSFRDEPSNSIPTMTYGGCPHKCVPSSSPPTYSPPAACLCSRPRIHQLTLMGGRGRALLYSAPCCQRKHPTQKARGDAAAQRALSFLWAGAAGRPGTTISAATAYAHLPRSFIMSWPRASGATLQAAAADDQASRFVTIETSI
jgi:hypothetical protein